ncbi:c-type cytochrome [Acidihalobacter sp.]|uniref:c-type cytochrome n=1 Tax=Acidihalobacter sp. TaxID=1872108 RepID=UPI00307F6C24
MSSLRKARPRHPSPLLQAPRPPPRRGRGETVVATASHSGKQIVDTVCISCHGSGVLGAPRIDSRAQWQPRVDQGFDVLLHHTVEGFKSMPPRGGNPSLSDAELKRAVAYMLDQAGIEAPKDCE